MDSSTWTLIVVVALVCAAVLGVAVALLLRLVRTRRDLRRAGLPTGPRWVFWGAVLYLVLPTDVLPDPVYLDDIGVLLLALRSVSAPLRAARRTGRLPGQETGRSAGRGTERENGHETGRAAAERISPPDARA
ncbi:MULTISPECIES: YkvA family protein [unclassified Streptomyces]|uniref:YkvA family protein n=1 Tax=unclassified Streptomyces TaxID=2593676 RepID=UPI000AF56279|nr:MULTISPECIES: YkvA family protein [unclassified Streptomyces]